MFTYDPLKAADRQAKGQDHCASKGRVFDLSTLIVDGLIHHPDDRSVVLIVGKAAGTTAQTLIYAVDENFSIHVGFDGVRGTPDAVKHETLFHNADVRAAGELEIDGGVIVEVGDKSGTYGTPGRIQTDPLFADAVLTALDRVGAPIEENERKSLERKAGRR